MKFETELSNGALIENCFTARFNIDALILILQAVQDVDIKRVDLHVQDAISILTKAERELRWLRDLYNMYWKERLNESSC